MDAVLITQLSDPDTVLLELKYSNTRFFIASTYFDIMTEIEKELDKLDQLLEFTKGNRLITAADSNSRLLGTTLKKRG